MFDFLRYSYEGDGTVKLDLFEDPTTDGIFLRLDKGGRIRENTSLNLDLRMWITSDIALSVD